MYGFPHGRLVEEPAQEVERESCCDREPQGGAERELRRFHYRGAVRGLGSVPRARVGGLYAPAGGLIGFGGPL